VNVFNHVYLPNTTHAAPRASNPQQSSPPAKNTWILRFATRTKQPYPATTQPNASKTAPAASKAGNPSSSSKNSGPSATTPAVTTITTTTGPSAPKPMGACPVSWCTSRPTARVGVRISRGYPGLLGTSGAGSLNAVKSMQMRA
jgi:hypothetical protein